MSLFLSLLTEVLHIGLMLLTAPLLAGLMDSLAARLAGTRGPGPLQAGRDLVHLWRKAPVTQDNLSLVSAIAPSLELGIMLAAAALVPSFSLGMALSPLADLLVIIGLLIGGRLVFALAAFDLGAARPAVALQDAARVGVLAEPALMLVIVALGLMAGSFNIDQVVIQQQQRLMQPVAGIAVALMSLLAIVLAESARTDTGRADVFNGPDLALATLAGWLRRLIWIDLIGALFLPIGMSDLASGPLGWMIGLMAWVVKLFLFLFCLGTVQTGLGRIPRHSLPDLIGVAALLALLAVLIILASSGAT